MKAVSRFRAGCARALMAYVKRFANQPVYLQLAAALLFISALVAVHAAVESGMNDDWSFILTAKDLAATGHLRYNGWSAPLIGFQAFWGALFIKLFGFSFFAVRCSTYVLTLLCIPVLWSLFLSASMTRLHAAFGLFTFLLSPLNLPNLATFMTDIPAFLLFVVSLLSAMKAWRARGVRSAIAWITATAISGMLSGSVRQIYWLFPVCALATLALVLSQPVRARLYALACTAATVAFGVASSHWLSQQPYVPAETTVQDLLHFSWKVGLPLSATYLARFLLGAAVLLLPCSLLTSPHWMTRRRVWVKIAIVMAALGLTWYLAQPLPWLGNTLSQDGVILRHTVSAGEKPLVLSSAAILLIGSVGVAAAGLALLRIHPFPLRSEAGRFAILTVPFLASYIAVLGIRTTSFGLYDRYLIPVVFLLSSLALVAHAGRTTKIPALSWAAAILFAFYAIATTHDYFAEARAKLKAAQQVLQHGESRLRMLAGFEFDCWTQTETTGYINNDLVTNPPGAYHDRDDCSGADDVQFWWRSLTPAISAKYVLALTPLPSLTASEYQPVEYQRWLPPVNSRVYIQRAAPPLTCKESPPD